MLVEPAPTPSRGGPVRSRTVARAGFAAAVLAWLFGLGHFAWAVGLPVLGATRQQFNEVGHRDAVEFTALGLIGAAGGFLALALVQPWGRHVPLRLLRVAAWLGAGVAVWAAAYGVIGLVVQALTATGYYDFPQLHRETATGWWWYWYALCAAAGCTFTATVWLTRRPRAPRRLRARVGRRR